MLSVECKCVSSQHWKYWGCVFNLCFASRMTLKRTWVLNTFGGLAPILVNRIGEGFSSLVTNHGFLPEALNTALSLRTRNLNGDWIEKLQTQGKCFLKDGGRSAILACGKKRKEIHCITTLKKLHLRVEFSVPSLLGEFRKQSFLLIQVI